jgi:uncharacterized membrane protein YbhN (UPF0104 family)
MHAHTAPPQRRRRGAWPWLAGAFTAALIALVVWLLLRQARQVDWPGVWQALRALPPGTLALGALLAWASHLAYGCFDLFGRHVLRHGLGVARTMGVTLTAYPFALNLGSIIGGVSVRWRLYSRQGLQPGQIGQVIVLSIITNWLGYCVLACAVFWAWAPPLPPGWEIGPHRMRLLGAVLAAVAALYLALCAWRGGRPLAVRGHELPLPRARVALLQMLLSCVNWALMGGALWALAGGQAPYAAALAAVLLGAVAGLLSRIPAGLGVIEAVGPAVLSPWMPASQALAVVLAYRALYYFAPLAVAGVALLAWEWRGKIQAKSASSAYPSSASSY